MATSWPSVTTAWWRVTRTISSARTACVSGFSLKFLASSGTPATQEAAGEGLYRTRTNFEPEVTFVLAKPLTLSVGASFQQMDNQFSAAEPEAANALISTLRYHRRLEDSENQHDLDAGYSLRAASKVLSSDFAYARHRVQFRYMLTRGKNVVIDDLTAGTISGKAPLFERFVLGNASTLRGWNNSTWIRWGETGLRIIPSNIDTGYFRFSTIRGPFGTAATRRCFGIRPASDCDRGCSPWRWRFRSAKDISIPSLWWV